MSSKFSIQHIVTETNNSNEVMFVASRAIVQPTNIGARSQFRAKRTLEIMIVSVELDANGGEVETNAIQKIVGQKIGELPDPTYGMKLFDGWYTSKIGGTKVDENTIVSSLTMKLYAHWINETQIYFNPNGGTITGSQYGYAYLGYPLNIKGSFFPTATGPTDKPNCIGFYTGAESGTKIEEDTIYDGSYTTLYPHYSAQSYTVELNNQWFKDNGSGVDPNGKSYGTSYSTNPDPNEYDGTYISYSNFNVNSGWAKMRIRFIGYSEFVVYIRSYAESNYDYTVIGSLDQNITSNPSSGYERTYGSQTSGTAISNYKKVTYSNLDGGEHFVDVVFRKDGSVNSNQDRGYVLIPKL